MSKQSNQRVSKNWIGATAGGWAAAIFIGFGGATANSAEKSNLGFFELIDLDKPMAAGADQDFDFPDSTVDADGGVASQEEAAAELARLGEPEGLDLPPPPPEDAAEDALAAGADAVGADAAGADVAGAVADAAVAVADGADPDSIDDGTPKVEIDTAADRSRRESEAASLAASTFTDFSDHKISVVEAVRMALRNNPSVSLAVTDSQRAEAQLKQIAGAFDLAFKSDVEYRHDQRETSDKEKLKEQSRYAAIRELNTTSKVLLGRIDDARKSNKQRSLDDVNFEGTPFGDPNSAVNSGEDSEFDDAEIRGLEFERDAVIESIIDVLSVGIDDEELSEFADRALENQQAIFRRIRDKTQISLEEQPPWFIRRTQTYKYRSALVKKFKGGPVGELYANLNANEDNFSVRGGSARTNRTQIGGKLSFNLTKLGLADPTTARFAAQRHQIYAQQEMTRAKVADIVLKTVQAYWRLAAAQERYRRLYLSELETLAIGAYVRKLISINEVPGAEESRLLARETNAVASRFGAEIQLAAAQQELALRIGFNPEDVYVSPLASDYLPELVSQSELAALTPPGLIGHTLNIHPDVLAFSYLKNASSILVEQARLDLKPDFKMFVGGEYTGYNEGSGWESIDAFGSRQAGPSFYVGGSFNMPFRNRTRQGALDGFQIEREVVDLTEDIKRRMLASQVTLGLHRVRISGQQASALRESSRQSLKSLGSVRARLQDADTNTTVIDVLNTEQEVTQSLLSEVNARLAHANAISQLRFATFTILPPFRYETIQTTTQQMILTPDYFSEVPSAIELTQYKVAAEHFREEDTQEKGLYNPYGAPKPEPILKRLTGAEKQYSLRSANSPPARDIRPGFDPDFPAEVPSQPAQVPIRPPSSDPIVVEPVEHGGQAPPPAASEKPKPLLKRLFRRG